MRKKQEREAEGLRRAVCNEILGSITGHVIGDQDHWDRAAVDETESNFEKGFWLYYNAHLFNVPDR